MQGVTLDYDVWLVHEGANGGKTTRRATLTGRQGENLPFVFAPIGFSLDGGVQPDLTSSPVRMTVDGAVRGRAMFDGSVELSLQSRRMLSHGNGNVSDAGTKSFIVKPEETTSIELPGAEFYSMVPATGTGVGSGIGRGIGRGTSTSPGGITKDGNVRIAWKEFFAGSKTSILVTVRRHQ